jgi:hypothetical protein
MGCNDAMKTYGRADNRYKLSWPQLHSLAAVLPGRGPRIHLMGGLLGRRREEKTLDCAKIRTQPIGCPAQSH